MPRQARSAPGGQVFHVLNRANGGTRLFRKKADFAAFERVLMEAMDRHPTRLLAWCLMPTHWHLVIWPEDDGEVTAFVRWLTHTHTQRWHAHYHTSGLGHVYQGRFKSFPIEQDAHLLTVLRYVQRNALRANLVSRAEDWRWSSLWARQQNQPELTRLLHDWPIETPADWIDLVNQPQTQAEIDALQHAIKRSCPYGSPGWVKRTATKLNLQWTLRPRGRPRIRPIKDSRPL